ncbi:hypothetical protein K9N68_37025 (plasmid) [Kovacikia minuta CCNUW1]|uniref:hypothetical protein n=1 Tax=Kovacikia minuta TaxID=2931930 RepID=UPI001CCC2A41|nr:hypothetical protein [Kovacikia minuta]UBF29819.1 hypothetical protein K9N68_37025 [Kovacikia minuta CCNUW1]
MVKPITLPCALDFPSLANPVQPDAAQAPEYRRMIHWFLIISSLIAGVIALLFEIFVDFDAVSFGFDSLF